uniref:TYR_PHOSPHATASE_2 domain-containing protein n=1 Tax=Caenorhabditis japonica TaxID=281687 RepID=A0A8R1DN25_CAEJA
MVRVCRVVPKDWTKFAPLGNVIPRTRFIVFKTPINSTLSTKIHKDQRFTTTDLFRQLAERGQHLGLVVDLTDTDKFYDKKDITGMCVQYEKINCPGRAFIERDECVENFNHAIQEYIDKCEDQDREALIGVHCTNGINRSGYLICRFLIETLGWSSHEAIDAFEQARGYSIEKGGYVMALHKAAKDARNKQADSDSDSEERRRKKKSKRKHRDEENIHMINAILGKLGQQSAGVSGDYQGSPNGIGTPDHSQQHHLQHPHQQQQQQQQQPHWGFAIKFAVFFLEKTSINRIEKTMFTAKRSMQNIRNVAIVGSGLMGSGIAQISASSGFNVTLIDVKKEVLERAMKSINSSLKRVAKKQSGGGAVNSDFASLSMARIKTSENVSSAVADADLIIEAAVENIDLKKGLFAQIEQASKPTAILATNTSSLRLENICKAIDDKTRFAGLHFFNPVPVMKLLEVVRTEETSDETYATLIKFGKAIGKTTVSCKDSPGFIVNRLLIPYCFEAVRMYEREDASMTDIDSAMKLGAGYPMGPFELMDYVGLDTLKFVMDGWVAEYPDNPLFAASPLLDALVSEGKLGRKTGEGFYSYKHKK